MKKSLFVFLFLFLMILQIPVFQTFQGNEIESQIYKQCASVELKDMGVCQDAEEFKAAVAAYAKAQGVSILTITYPYSGGSAASSVELYCAGSVLPPALTSRGVTDKKAQALQSSGVSLSSKAGDFSSFSTKRAYTLLPFSSLQGASLAREYFVYPKNQAVPFQSFLEERYDVAFFSAEERIVLEESSLTNLAILAVLSAAFLVFFAFWVVSASRTNAVKRLLGYSNARCFWRMAAEFFALFFSALGVAFVFDLIFLGVFNRWQGLFPFLSSVAALLLPVCLFLLLASLLFLLLFYSGDVRYALKGKKPFLQLNLCAGVLKTIVILFVCFATVTLYYSIQHSSKILEQKERFEQIASYRIPRLLTLSMDSNYSKQFDDNCKALYQKTEGVLINPEDYSFGEDSKALSGYGKYTVYINNNYLKKNPIYDTQGKQVNIDEASLKHNETVVLVPEQYRGEAAKIQAYYDKWYLFSRYANEGGAEKDPLNRTITVRLLFVKSNQTYFAFDTELSDYEENFIHDPFAVLVTKENMGSDHYTFHITNGHYMAEVSRRQSADDIYKSVRLSSLEQELVELPTVYSCVDAQIEKYTASIAQASLILALSILITAVITVYLTRNFMAEHKKTILVKKMLGYAPGRVYSPLLLFFLLFDLSLFSLAALLLRLPTGLWLLLLAGFTLLDLALELGTAAHYQTKLVLDTLKGDD